MSVADINSVVLVGRLTRDAELKYTNSGIAVSKLGLAVNRRRKKDGQWIDEVHFFDIVVWGKTAEALKQYLTKGKQIGVQGELTQNRWEQDGQQKSRVEIVANNIQLLGGGAGSGGAGSGSGGNSNFGNKGGTQGTDSQGGQNISLPPDTNPPDDFEDDIPF